jgi:hypothetical protein
MIRTRTAGTRFRRRFAASTQSGLDVWRSDMAICWGGGGIKQSFRNKPQSKVKAERACVASCFHMQGWFRAGRQFQLDQSKRRISPRADFDWAVDAIGSKGPAKRRKPYAGFRDDIGHKLGSQRR